MHRRSPIKSYKGRKLKPGHPVDVYRNLNSRGITYSVRQDGLVIGHVRAIMLQQVKFVVRDAGRRRALATKRRNVHAWLTGTVIPSGMGTTAEEASKLPRFRYDLRHGFLQLVTSPPGPLKTALVAVVNQNGGFFAY